MFATSLLAARLHRSDCAFLGWLSPAAVADPNPRALARFADRMCEVCKPLAPAEWARVQRGSAAFIPSRTERERAAGRLPALVRAAATLRAAMASRVGRRGPGGRPRNDVLSPAIASALAHPTPRRRRPTTRRPVSPLLAHLLRLDRWRRGAARIG